ncbi:MAG: hypothetical protein JW925_05335 [Syntrophaceae bacterium]|nr:hypothetical protein [Syntrophaceae bacterium]
MKKLFLSSLIVFITASIMSSPSVCFPEKPDPEVWEHLSDNFYYNKTNLIKSSNIISIWTYRTIADKERKHLIEHFKESDVKKSTRYQNLDHQTMLLDIDCRKKLSKIEKLANYDDKGNVLYEETYKNSDWTGIVPESKLDETYRIICDTPEKRQKISALKKQCERECEEWVNADEKKFFRDKFTHQNHYNASLDKCFILVNYSKKQLKILREINENKIYGSFRSKKDGSTILCNVLEKICKSESEWDSLVKPYMEE